MSFTGSTVYSGQPNRGTDRKITIRRLDTGLEIKLGGRLQSFETSDKDTIEEVDGIDNNGLVDHSYHAGAVTGNVSVARYNGDFEDFAKIYNANFYSGGETILCEIIAETNNPYDRTRNIDTYTKCVLGQLKSGPFEPKRNPKMSFTFHAQQKL